MTRILVVEDDAAILRGIADNLRYEGYEVVSATSAEEGIERLERDAPELIVLDVMLPGKNGFEMCRQVRQQGSEVPILMLTARSSEFDKVMGLDLGADDYMVKPFSILELLARVRALLRRGDRAGEMPDRIHFGDVTVDFKRFEATKQDEILKLTRKEFGVLQCLASRGGEVVTRDDLLEDVWGAESYPTTRTIDNHIAMLRAKIEHEPSSPKYLVTVHGVGYKLVIGPWRRDARQTF